MDGTDDDGFWDEPLRVFLREYEKAKGDTEWQVVYHYAPLMTPILVHNTENSEN